LPVTISFAEGSHPSPADMAAGLHYAINCAGGSLDNATYATSDEPTSNRCTFPDIGTYKVTGVVVDKDEGKTVYSTDVVVADIGANLATGVTVDHPRWSRASR
jgi:hypothetical protein